MAKFALILYGFLVLWDYFPHNFLFFVKETGKGIVSRKCIPATALCSFDDINYLFVFWTPSIRTVIFSNWWSRESTRMLISRDADLTITVFLGWIEAFPISATSFVSASPWSLDLSGLMVIFGWSLNNDWY